MKDQYQRKIDYLRISVTDRCNFRCKYCMPEDGVESICHNEILTYEEILRLCRIAAGIGIKKIKITGGEPFVRKGVCSLIREIRKVPGIESVTITTNGMLLAGYLPDLEEAGISGINISLDTLDREKFHRITRTGSFDEVWDGFLKAVKTEIPIKINCVPMRGFNEDELVKMAALSREFPVTVRFIEMMPIGIGTEYAPVFQDEIKRMLEAEYGELIPTKECLGNGPAKYYKLTGFQRNIGFISAVSHEFCETCNRVRLTADGILKPCLNYESHLNLKQAMREEITDTELEALFRDGIYRKPRCHNFGGTEKTGTRETRRMSGIGG